MNVVQYYYVKCISSKNKTILKHESNRDNIIN